MLLFFTDPNSSVVLLGSGNETKSLMGPPPLKLSPKNKRFDAVQILNLAQYFIRSVLLHRASYLWGSKVKGLLVLTFPYRKHLE